MTRRSACAGLLLAASTLTVSIAARQTPPQQEPAPVFRAAADVVTVDASVQQGLRRSGLPTREDHEDVVFRIEQLEHRVRMLEDRPAPPPPPAGEPEVTPEPEETPETPPGL